MGHLFVPAALVLWVAVAVVRMWATPQVPPTPAPAPQERQSQQQNER
ncbi:hypothetical protein [Hyalangium rubrum]|uniref:Uncharacterized protein n=1 Tax=Hyalangium rubrum TaxID=3103134 RepID=A0ABU5HF05_9BACT|nr:hypothetical protein [Hyalangium sp. s54d21]MDY7231387.1 hypothetical protein [Hyalangium sp. s54d21]